MQKVWQIRNRKLITPQATQVKHLNNYITPYYKIVVRNCPNWRDFDTCLIGISMGVDYFDGNKFLSLLHWADTNFKNLIILIADTAYRHNVMAENLVSEEKALAETKKISDQWLDRNKKAINKLNKDIIIFHWDDWLLREDTQKLIKKFHKVYLNELNYQNAVNKDVQGFLDRKERRGEEIKDKLFMFQKSIDYLLEESAIDTVMAPFYPSLDAYPGPELNCQKIVRLGKIPALPDDMKFFARAEIKFIKN